MKKKTSLKAIAKVARSDFYESVAQILRAARSNAHRAVNFAMVEAYWTIGRMIVKEEQEGKERAEYGAYLLQNLASRLSEEFGKGFDERELRKTRQLFTAFPIRDSLRPELSWTHYRALIRVEKEQARAWYLTEAAEQNWSVRALERQIHSLYYERLRMAKDQALVIEEMREKTAPLAPTPADFIKGSKRLFASRYKLCLPSEEELRAEIERERELIVREQEAQYA